MGVDTLITEAAWSAATPALSADQQARKNARVLEAYSRLSTNQDFRLIVEDMVLTVLLKAAETPEQEGERRLVLKIIEAMKHANTQRQQEEDRG